MLPFLPLSLADLIGAGIAALALAFSIAAFVRSIAASPRSRFVVRWGISTVEDGFDVVPIEIRNVGTLPAHELRIERRAGRLGWLTLDGFDVCEVHQGWSGTVKLKVGAIEPNGSWFDPGGGGLIPIRRHTFKVRVRWLRENSDSRLRTKISRSRRWLSDPQVQKPRVAHETPLTRRKSARKAREARL